MIFGLFWPFFIRVRCAIMTSLETPFLSSFLVHGVSFLVRFTFSPFLSRFSLRFFFLDIAMAPCRQAEHAAGARWARIAPRRRCHPRLAPPCATHANALVARAREHSPLQLTTHKLPLTRLCKKFIATACLSD